MTDFLHYESSFEEHLRGAGWPFVRVDDQRRSVFSGASVKSFDFLIRAGEGEGWLVDVKGRKFPYETADGGRHAWENWVTDEDLTGLASWERVFGAGFRAVFVFAYWLTEPGDLPALGATHRFRGREYAFLAIPRSTYAAHARRRSDLWGTVSMPTALFRRHARPVFSDAPVQGSSAWSRDVETPRPAIADLAPTSCAGV